MASSTLSGDRRWASARKSGMTILGKVPKPINLPSQRLENNGVDPNVEIVPKGTLTWGNRPSSATSNVWTSSTLLSPRTDGSTSSPSNYGGRPSSGGSGARPSTAGSDSSQDPSQNAWGSSSRPSTASGLLSSNQTPVTAARPRSAETGLLVTARPRSADTKPGSSQLSRFAENTAESAVAWGATRNAEKLGGTPSKDDKFSLSSQDFPTLGSEKKSEPHSQQLQNQQGHSQEHTGVPSGSNEKLGLPLNGDGSLDQENASTLGTETNAYAGGGISSNTELQINPKQGHPYKGLKLTSQFDSRHGPPVHSPDRIWYRGGAIGGPYRPSGPLGNFPGDSFAHYPPFPPNSEAVPRPRPGAGPVVYHPTNGETYGHQVPHNSFMFPSHPIIPARPGPYQASVPYDGYYNYIQASFCRSSEHQTHSTGVAARPIAYNQHSKNSGNFGAGEFHNSPGDTRMAEEKFASDTIHISQGPYKVLLKHSDRVDSHPQVEHNGSSLLQAMEDKPEGSMPKDSEMPNGRRQNETKKLSIKHLDQADLVYDVEYQPSALVANLDEISCSTSEGILKREPDAATKVGHSQKRNLVTRKNTLLFEKIEGLNNKIRLADGQSITGELSLVQEKSKQQMVVNPKPEHSATSVSSKSAHTENVPISGSKFTSVTVEGSSTDAPKSNDIVVPVSADSSPSSVIDASKLSVDSAVVTGQSEPEDLGLMKSDYSKPNVTGSRFPKRINATQSRGVYDAKSVSATLADVGWTRDSSGRESSVPFDKAVTEESILISSSESPDHKAQRAKLKEMAAQRAKQLQEEEEERTREQKAKALAKLEELNRRSAAQSMFQKSDDGSSARNSFQQQENSEVVTVPNNTAVDILDGTLVGSTDTSLGSNECIKQETSVGLPLKPSALTPEILSLDYTSSVIPLSVEHETNETNAIALTTQDNSSQTLIVGVSKNKQMGYRRRLKVPMAKTSGEKPIIVPNVGPKHQDGLERQIKESEERATGGIKEAQQNLVDINASELHSGTSIHNGDSSQQHKKKNSRNSRNKNKDEDFVGSVSFYTHMQENMEHPSETFKIHPAATSSVPAIISSENSKNLDLGDDVVPSCQTSSKINEEAHDRMSNQWKPQPSRRPARNQQPSKPMSKSHGSDTVIWAPVKPANKNEQQSEEIIQSGILKIDSQSSQRIEHSVHNGPRTKRAEMERYVPKPVAKELLQLDSIRKPSVNVHQATACDILDKSNLASKGSEMGKFDGSSAGTDYATNIKNEEDNKPSRRGKVHASWRQRSSESILPLQSSNENLHPSDATKFPNKSSDQYLLGLEQLKSDGWESSSNIVIKEQGITYKTKSHPVYKDAGSNYGPPNHHHSCGAIDEKDGLTSPILDTSESDVRNSLACENKNACVEHIRSHSLWKPKSQISSQNQQPSRGNGGQRNFSQAGRRSEKFASPTVRSISSSNMDKTPLNQKDTAQMVADKGHRKTMVEIGSFSLDISEELMHAPKPVVPSNTAKTPDSNDQHENQVTSPPRRHGHRNGRFNRGQEAIYRSKGLMQESGNLNVRINEDQEKVNPHFEYQPIGWNEKPSDLFLLNSNTDQEAHGRHVPRQRYKERDNRIQARNPGRFIRRNSVGIAHVDDFHNSEE